MPFYVFKCIKCDHQITELRKMGDTKPPKSCGNCEECSCGKGPCEFAQILAPANFKIDPAAG